MDSNFALFPEGITLINVVAVVNPWPPLITLISEIEPFAITGDNIAPNPLPTISKDGVELYSNPGEVVLTPFMGVGSEVFSPVSMGRKAIGIELKDSYFKQAILNCKEAEKRFKESVKQISLLDQIEEDDAI